MFFRISLIFAVGILASCSSPKTSLTPKAGFSGDWAEFERLAKRNRTRVALPPFETTPQASLDAITAVIADADARLENRSFGASDLLGVEPGTSRDGILPEELLLRDFGAEVPNLGSHVAVGQLEPGTSEGIVK